MTTATPIRNGRKIIGYKYRGVSITRHENYFEFLFDRFDNFRMQVTERTISATVAKIDEMLDSVGRTTGGKLVVTNVVDGRVQTSLADSDWRHPHARITSDLWEVNE
jgi:hypothetical protein